MVMYDIKDFTNETMLGHASDKVEPVVNDHWGEQVPGYEEILPCACESCLEKFYQEIDCLDDDDFDDDIEGYLAADLHEAAETAIENLLFLGNCTTTKDVMIAILGLEAVIASVKIHLLDSE